MTWDDGSWNHAPASTKESRGQLTAPVAAGLVAALVIHIALFTVILAVAVGVSDPQDGFGTGAALWWGTLGAAGLGAACAAGARVCFWVAGNRGVNIERARKAARFALAGFAVPIVALGLAPALRPVTLPVYVLLAAAGIFLATREK